MLEVGATPPVHLIAPFEVANTGPAAIAPVMYDSIVTTWSAISPFVNSVYVSPVVAVEIFWHELDANNSVVFTETVPAFEHASMLGAWFKLPIGMMPLLIKSPNSAKFIASGVLLPVPVRKGPASP